MLFSRGARYGCGGVSRAGTAADATIDTFEDLPKALDGLFLMIGDEEKKIRRNPVGQASTLLQKVFGALPK